MTKFKCNQCGKDTVYQSGMKLCPYCQSEYPDSQVKLMSESADILGSIDTAKASATLAAPLYDEDDEVSVGSSKTALAADLGYVDNPRHMKSLTTELAYGSTAGRSTAIPTRTVGDEDSDSEIRDYKLETEIGQGSFGTVYRAIQVPLDRSVAIKLLKPLPLAPSTEGDQSKASRVQQETSDLHQTATGLIFADELGARIESNVISAADDIDSNGAFDIILCFDNRVSFFAAENQFATGSVLFNSVIDYSITDVSAQTIGVVAFNATNGVI